MAAAAAAAADLEPAPAPEPQLIWWLRNLEAKLAESSKGKEAEVGSGSSSGEGLVVEEEMSQGDLAGGPAARSAQEQEEEGPRVESICSRKSSWEGGDGS